MDLHCTERVVAILMIVRKEFCQLDYMLKNISASSSRVVVVVVVFVVG